MTLWTGLPTVRDGRAESDGRVLSLGSNGAVVRAIALATSREHFETRTRTAATELGLSVECWEEVMTLAELTAGGRYRGLESVGDQASKTSEVVFGTFHNFFSE